MKQTLEETARSEREKIILELHDDYSIHKDPEHYIISSGVIQKYAVPIFKAGAEWHAKQSPWISVEERLPEDFQEVLILRTYIGAKSRERRYEVFTQTFFKEYGFEICETRKELKEKVLAWMPIPSFDEILEVNRDVLERIKEKGD